MAEELKPVNEEDLKLLKERMNLIASADPSQYHNDFSLRRYLRAFKTVDSSFQAIIKTNKWRNEYGVEQLCENKELIEKYNNKARVLRHRDIVGRPIVYIPAKNHSSSDRNIDDLTKFIVYCLVLARWIDVVYGGGVTKENTVRFWIQHFHSENFNLQIKYYDFSEYVKPPQQLIY